MNELDLTAAMAVIPVLVGMLVQAIKQAAEIIGISKYIDPVKPLLPVLAAFGFAFVPGLGLESASIGMKLIAALSASGVAGAGYEMIKRGAGAVGAKRAGNLTAGDAEENKR